jgi:type II secretory pathway component PulK
MRTIARRRKRHRVPLRDERGVVLIIVLVVVALLTITVTEFTYSVQLDQHRVRNAVHALQADLLARSGINLAEGFLTQDDEPTYDAYSEQWWLDLQQFCQGLELGETMALKCTVQDESGKINVNLSRTTVQAQAQAQAQSQNGNERPTRDAFVRDALRRLFEAHNLDVQIVDRLKDYWLQEPQPSPDGRLRAVPDFSSLEDFAATFGIPTRELTRLRKVLTAQPRNILGGININTAPAEVLSAVINDAQAVDDILSKQTSDEPFTSAGTIREALGNVEDSAILASLFTVRSSLFRLEASAIVNRDPSGGSTGGVGQTLSELVVRRRDPRKTLNVSQTGSQTASQTGGQAGANVPGWTLRPLDWQKEGGARLIRHPDQDQDQDQENQDSLGGSKSSDQDGNR